MSSRLSVGRRSSVVARRRSLLSSVDKALPLKLGSPPRPLIRFRVKGANNEAKMLSFDREEVERLCQAIGFSLEKDRPRY